MIKPLVFGVGLRDWASPGIAKIQGGMKSMNKLVRQSKREWIGVGANAGGMIATGASIKASLQPAREMEAARGELASLLNGDGKSTLDLVQKSAMDLAENYGWSAAEVVKASYDIQSSIDGLNGHNLASFTKVSGVLATATKADTATVTNYMGTMYGIFKDNANKMGKSQWVEKIAGQTASSVKLFKTTGGAMNEAFSGLGSRAANQGINAAEQFAVLGMLQSTKKGSVAGTAYAGFMDAIPQAEKVLGVSLSNAQGKALGMVDTIDRLKGILGSDLGVAEIGWLNKAFGTNAAGMLQDLWNKTDALKDSIQTLDQVKGMENAIGMAKKIADPWNRLTMANKNVMTTFGQLMNTALLPWIEIMIRGAQKVRRWIELFPNLSRWVGFAALAIMVMTVAVSALAVATGTWKIAMGGMGLLLGGTLKGALGLASGLASLIPIMWGAATAGMATLIGWGWIALAALAVVGGIGALIYYWDEWTSALANIEWFKIVSQAFQGMMSWVSELTGAIGEMWQSATGWFESSISVDAEKQQRLIMESMPYTGGALAAATVTAPTASPLPMNTPAQEVGTTIGSVNLYPQHMKSPEDLKRQLEMWMPA